MQVITIDKKKNPDIADFAADLQPGDPVDLHATIKANDDQFLTLTVESASEGKDEKEPDDEEEAETPAPGESDSPPQAGETPDMASDIAGSEQAGM